MTTPKITSKPKILRVFALASRVSLQFPYRINQIGKPSNIVILRGQFTDLDEDDISELDNTISNLKLNKIIATVRIGYSHDAGDIGYAPVTPGSWLTPPEDVSSALDQLIALATGSNIVFAVRTVTGDTVLSPIDTFVKVDSVAPVNITLPPLSKGKLVVVKRVNVGVVTILGPIDGGSQAVLKHIYDSVPFMGDTNEWSVAW